MFEQVTGLYLFLFVMQLIIALLLIVSVIFQTTKSGNMYSGAEMIVNRSGGPNILEKITTVLAFLFFCNSLFISYEFVRDAKSKVIVEPVELREDQIAIPTDK